VTLFVWAWLFQGFFYDDAYIAFRFSDNWAKGNGLVWNLGEPVVEGFTSFLWVMVGALIQYLANIPPHQSMVYVGIVSWLVMVGIVMPLLAKIVAPDKPDHDLRPTRVICVLSIIAIPQVALGAFQGLETALHSLLFALLILLALRADSPRFQIILVLGSVAAYMNRPDALAFIFPLWMVIYVFTDRNSRRAARLMFAILLVLLLIYTAMKWHWSGYPFPNTFYIKKGAGLQGLGYVKNYFMALTPVWLFIAYAIGRISARKLLTDRRLCLLLIPSIIFCCSYAMLNPTMGAAFRFLIPTWPFFTLAALRIEALRQEKEMIDRNPIMTIKTIVVFGLILGALTLNSWRLMRGEYPGITELCALTRQANVSGGIRFAATSSLKPAPVLATGDIGALAYFSELKTIDLIGLTDTTVAHHGLTHEYLCHISPDIFVLQDLHIETCPTVFPSGAPHLTLNGTSRWLDLRQYGSVLSDPANAHNGLGSTYQVVTSPGFAERYVHVGHLPFGSKNGYPVFLRRDYVHFDKIVELWPSNR